MKNVAFVIALLSLPLAAWSQIQQNGLVGYFSLDNCDQLDTTNVYDSDFGVGSTMNVIKLAGSQICVEDCSVRGNSFSLNGTDQQLVFFTSQISAAFALSDFSISFYFKPEPASARMNLFMDGEDCSDDNHFAIDYNPTANRVEVKLSESSTIGNNLNGALDPTRCWQHVAFVREGNTTTLYVNGELADQNSSATRINITNNSVLVCASNVCADRFNGLIDEIAIYDEAINALDVENLFFNPEEIVNRDTTIFLGGSVQIALTNNCADSYSWSPNSEINDATSPTPILMPTLDAVYSVDMISSTCTATDQIAITVIDPDALDCNEVFFPKAFTPNDDNLNEEFRINNPYSMDELLSFEILDRWGARVFFTDNALEGWDGSFAGQDVNPGVLLYRVRFVCDGVENTQIGSLTLIR